MSIASMKAIHLTSPPTISSSKHQLKIPQEKKDKKNLKVSVADLNLSSDMSELYREADFLEPVRMVSHLNNASLFIRMQYLQQLSHFLFSTLYQEALHHRKPKRGMSSGVVLEAVLPQIRSTFVTYFEASASSLPFTKTTLEASQILLKLLKFHMNTSPGNAEAFESTFRGILPSLAKISNMHLKPNFVLEEPSYFVRTSLFLLHGLQQSSNRSTSQQTASAQQQQQQQQQRAEVVKAVVELSCRAGIETLLITLEHLARLNISWKDLSLPSRHRIEQLFLQTVASDAENTANADHLEVLKSIANMCPKPHKHRYLLSEALKSVVQNCSGHILLTTLQQVMYISAKLPEDLTISSPLPPIMSSKILSLGVQVAETLEYIHQTGLSPVTGLRKHMLPTSFVELTTHFWRENRHRPSVDEVVQSLKDMTTVINADIAVTDIDFAVQENQDSFTSYHALLSSVTMLFPLLRHVEHHLTRRASPPVPTGDHASRYVLQALCNYNGYKDLPPLHHHLYLQQLSWFLLPSQLREHIFSYIEHQLLAATTSDDIVGLLSLLAQLRLPMDNCPIPDSFYATMNNALERVVRDLLEDDVEDMGPGLMSLLHVLIDLHADWKVLGRKVRHGLILNMQDFADVAPVSHDTALEGNSKAKVGKGGRHHSNQNNNKANKNKNSKVVNSYSDQQHRVQVVVELFSVLGALHARYDSPETAKELIAPLVHALQQNQRAVTPPDVARLLTAFKQMGISHWEHLTQIKRRLLVLAAAQGPPSESGKQVVGSSSSTKSSTRPSVQSSAAQVPTTPPARSMLFPTQLHRSRILQNQQQHITGEGIGLLRAFADIGATWENMIHISDSEYGSSSSIASSPSSLHASLASEVLMQEAVVSILMQGLQISTTPTTSAQHQVSCSALLCR